MGKTFRDKARATDEDLEYLKRINRITSVPTYSHNDGRYLQEKPSRSFRRRAKKDELFQELFNYRGIER
jgi:hypothetical protein